MKGILIFDHLNDVLFTKCNQKFANHIQKLARVQGLISENKVLSIFIINIRKLYSTRKTTRKFKKKLIKE